METNYTWVEELQVLLVLWGFGNLSVEAKKIVLWGVAEARALQCCEC